MEKLLARKRRNVRVEAPRPIKAGNCCGDNLSCCGDNLKCCGDN